METIIGSVMAAIGIIVLVVFISLMRSARHAVYKYEYLEVLSFIEWKSGHQVHVDLQTLKRIRISCGEMYSDLRILEGEGLVISRTICDQSTTAKEFKRIPKRYRRRDEDQENEADRHEGSPFHDGLPA